MGFGRTGRRAGARRTLDRTQAQAALLNQLRQARHDIKERSHVARLFLYPNYFASVGMGIKSGGDFGTRQRIELVEKQYRGTGVFTRAAFEGWQIWMLSSAASCRKRSRRALECSGPWPSNPCGNSSTMPDGRSHLSSP